MERETRIEKAYEIAREEYFEIGVDTEQVLDRLHGVSISIHCWQTDDVSGFEKSDASL
jgi:L-rhamnose isomerase